MTENNTPETTEAPAPAAPFMRVLKGNPTDAQTATLALLFAGMANGAGVAEDKGPRNDWGRLEERFNQTHEYVPGTFRNLHFF